jgi:hypothetical protein
VVESQSTMDRIGLTRGKAALIGVLALVLIGLIARQFGGPDEELYVNESAAQTVRGWPAAPAAGSISSPNTTQPGKADSTPVRMERSAGEGRPARPAPHDDRWRPAELSEAIAYDPFALPASFPQPPQLVVHATLAAGSADRLAPVHAELARAIERLRLQLEGLQQRGVHVIVNHRGQNEYVAMIGDRTLHVGDEIDGFTVTAIDPDGVRVEKKGME